MSENIIIRLFESIPLWVMIIPIILCSIVFIGVVIERLIFYKKIDVDYRLLIHTVREKIIEGKINDAITLCKEYNGILVEMVMLILEKWQNGSDNEIVIRDMSEKAIRKVEKFGGVVSTIATISPMLGLLGTVTGMLKSFSGLARLGPTARDLLALGITEALITTALGLLVAIPSIMFYNYMVTKIDYYIREVEFVANALDDTKG